MALDRARIGLQNVGQHWVLSHELSLLPVRAHPLPWETPAGGWNLGSSVYLPGLRAAVQRPQWYAVERKLAGFEERWSPPAPEGSDVTLEADELYTRVEFIGQRVKWACLMETDTSDRH